MRALAHGLALALPLALLAGCGSSRLSDADLTRFCALQARCGTFSTPTQCESLVRAARDDANIRGCGGPFGAAGRCAIRADSCGASAECADQETRLDECLDSPPPARADAGSADTRIPVVPGTEGAIRQTNGFLEVFNEGEWRGVCDDSFDTNDGIVVCRQLGTPAFGEIVISDGLSGSGAFWVDDLACTGTEPNIAACPSATWGVENCSNGEHVLVTCN